MTFSERYGYLDAHLRRDLMHMDDTFMMMQMLQDTQGNSMRNVLFSYALHGNVSKVQMVLEEVLEGGFPFLALIERHILPTFLHLQRLEDARKIDHLQHLLAKRSLTNAVQGSAPNRSGSASTRGMVLLFTVHESLRMELGILEARFISEGWSVMNLERTTDITEIIHSCASQSLEALFCLVKEKENGPDATRMLTGLGTATLPVECLFGTLPILLHCQPPLVRPEIPTF